MTTLPHTEASDQSSEYLEILHHTIQLKISVLPWQNYH